MLFNSFTFLAFFAVVYGVYVACGKRVRTQNVWLLCASYFFYGWWDWRFLSLIAISTCVDFVVSHRIAAARSERVRRRYLWISLASNLSILGFFKYFDFFSSGAVALLEAIGLSPSASTLSIVLPIGISFYTFQTMGYTIDVYRQRVPPASNWIDFALFVAFFPQLVAGPIERARTLLPQIQARRHISATQIHEGLFLVAWGYFKKLVIADGVGSVVSAAFDPAADVAGLDIAIGILAFGLQIYCDFSGYSDIARGLAKWLGFELMVNFRIPYVSASPAEFWSRWHISLSTWLRDYLYVPLGGNQAGRLRVAVNVAVTMLLGGLWHGAAWTFVAWGAYQALLALVYRALGRQLEDAGRARFRVLRVLVFFALFNLGWLFFRAADLSHSAMLWSQLGWRPSADSAAMTVQVALRAAPLVLVEILQLRSGNLTIFTRGSALVRVAVLAGLLLGIALFGARGGIEFIYFQF